MKILLWPHPTLKKVSDHVDIFDQDLIDLTDEMYGTMKKAGGVGLSAVQVGILKRVVVADVGDGKQIFINPKVAKIEDRVPMLEGCLSVPGFFETISRFETVQVDYQDVYGTQKTAIATGLLGHVLQHECEHLDGILFVDRISSAKRSLIRGNMSKARR